MKQRRHYGSRIFSPNRLGLVILALIAALGLAYSINPNRRGVDLLNGQDWSHFAGAESTTSGIHINPLGQVITHRDTSLGQRNSPINVRGPYLLARGDFEIEAELANIDYGASLHLYGQVPVIYDEWRQERESVRFDITDDTLKVRIWDGSSSNSLDERSFKIEKKDNRKITVRAQSGELSILLNDDMLGSMPEHDIFDSGTVWFGADTLPGSKGWTLSSLRARGLGKQEVEIVSAPSIVLGDHTIDTLRNLAAGHPRNLPIGAAVSLYPLLTDNNYRNIVLGQFSMLTPENSMKPQSLHPQKHTYSFADADSLVEIAAANNILVHGHALVMPKANALWMEKSRYGDRQKIMVDHITTVVGRYKGKVAQWDVVNEVLSEEDEDYTNKNQGLRKQMWFNAMGEGYIDEAFRAARAADSSAKLYLNDYGIEKDGMRWEALINLIQRLQARGVPIDGVGFEAHVYQKKDSINPEILRKHIQELALLGILARVSEIDVLGGDEQFQAEQYADILKVCLSEPTCTSYGTWGITDLYGSTTLPDRYPMVLGDSLLWDKKMTPKPAFFEVRKVLE